VRLKEQSLKRYLEFYERAITTPFRYGHNGQVGTFRDWLRAQAGGLKKALLDNRPFAPTVLEL